LHLHWNYFGYKSDSAAFSIIDVPAAQVTGNAGYTAAGLKCPVRSGFFSSISQRRPDTGKCPRHSWTALARETAGRRKMGMVQKGDSHLLPERPEVVKKGYSHLLPERPEGCFAQKVAVTFLNVTFLNHAEKWGPGRR
jgi:hypothetical protein